MKSMALLKGSYLRRSLPVFLITLALSIARAEQLFPKEGWKDKPNPLANPSAVVGGEISVFVGQYSKSFNYYLDNNTFTSEIFSAMFDTLLGVDPITADFTPGLAERWSISDDKKTFTFRIDKRAKWSDGAPVTARDVEWIFNIIMDPKSLTGVHKVALERFLPPKVVDNSTIKFTAKEVHWSNLLTLGGLNIMPWHAYHKKNFNKINFEFPVVSGPYRLGKIKESIYVKIERRDDWWHGGDKRFRNTGNFQTIVFRFFAERENAYEAFRKGMIDIFPVYTSRIWANETTGEKFEKNWIIKQKVYNYEPARFQGFAMNMRRPPFDDVRTRKAMAHLVDREKMNRTIMYSQYTMHVSYFEDLYTPDNPCKNPFIKFDKNKARELLADAGWKANPKTGLLEKDGKTFRFKFLTRAASSEKFVNIFAEDLKDVGIELSIDKKDWAAWVKDMDEFNFDMTWAAWGASIFKDPEDMWASKEADRQGGNNYTGFKDQRVDSLIEKQKTIFDINERHAICREIDSIITRQFPYVLLWQSNYIRLLYWNKFETPPTVLTKFDDENSAFWYWWYDQDSAADLADARKKGYHLPGRKTSVKFDEEFRKH